MLELKCLTAFHQWPLSFAEYEDFGDDIFFAKQVVHFTCVSVRGPVRELNWIAESCSSIHVF